MGEIGRVAVEVCVVAVVGLLVTWLGDPVVRRVFRAAGDVPRVDADAAAREALEAERALREAVDVEAGADLGELDVLSGGVPTPVAGQTAAEAAGAKLRGGKVIGWLERIAVYASILSGFPTGIAAIVAVKGLARYPDLKSSDGTAERFILGTFASILTAAGGAGLAYWLVRVF
ncbi:hypothetical protein GCM10027418_03840 [Mariniluteicoccus endophyticus]